MMGFFRFCLLLWLGSMVLMVSSESYYYDYEYDENGIPKEVVEKLEEEAKNYLKEITPTLEKNLLWVYENNFKDKSKLSLVDQISLQYEDEEVMEFFKTLTDKFKEYPYKEFKDKDLARQILLLISRDERVLSSLKRQEFKDLQEESKNFLTNARFCEHDSNNCTLKLDDILYNMVLSDEKNISAWYWKEFTNKCGTQRREKFDRYLKLYDEIASKNGFTSASHMLLVEYEDKNILQKIRQLVNALHPLYEQFHAYIRNQLHENFGSNIPEKGPIPYNYILRYFILTELGDQTLDYPFSSSPIPDYSQVMQAQNYTPQRLIEQADDFFKSMGITSALTKDWREFIRRDDQSNNEYETCVPKAKTYLARGSLAFTYCDEINFRNFYNTHAEMLVVQQYNHARNLPLVYRRIFPPAFEQALEKTLKFSVSTPAYMKKIGIISEDQDHTNPELLINRLYFLAFKVLVDILKGFAKTEYFINLIDHKYNSSNSNCEYWRLQEKYLGVQPLTDISNSDFDYIAMEDEIHDKDFEEVVARFTAFNIYESLCKVSGKYEKNSTTHPLNNCDFSGSADAGRVISKIMNYGASKSWHQIFSEITLKDDLDASSILEYFQPLYIFLKKENKKNKVHIGWSPTYKCT